RLTSRFIARSLPGRSPGVGSLPSSVAVADVNGDGRPDLVVANGGENAVRVLMGNGGATFAAQQTFQVGHSPSSVAVADLTGHGRPVLVVANYGVYDRTTDALRGSSVSVLRGRGDATFDPLQTLYGCSGPSSVAVADVNGDGRPDLVVA